GSPRVPSRLPARRDTRPGTSWPVLRHLELAELAQLLEQAIRPLGLRGVDDAEREADVDEHIVANARLGQLFQADAADGTTELRPAHADAAVGEDLDDAARDGEAHQPRSRSASRRAAMAAWPRARPPSFAGTWRCVYTWNPSRARASSAAARSRAFWKTPPIRATAPIPVRRRIRSHTWGARVAGLTWEV